MQNYENFIRKNRTKNRGERKTSSGGFKLFSSFLQVEERGKFFDFNLALIVKSIKALKAPTLPNFARLLLLLSIFHSIFRSQNKDNKKTEEEKCFTSSFSDPNSLLLSFDPLEHNPQAINFRDTRQYS